MEETLQKLLTVEEVMQVLRISRPTLYRMLRAAKLEPVKIGKRTLFEMTDIRALIDRSKHGINQVVEEGKPKKVREPKKRIPRAKGVKKEVATDEQKLAGKKTTSSKEQSEEVPLETTGKKEKPGRKIEDEKQGRLL
jgi:excisionase family DNA binding protein